MTHRFNAKLLTVASVAQRLNTAAIGQRHSRPTFSTVLKCQNQTSSLAAGGLQVCCVHVKSNWHPPLCCELSSGCSPSAGPVSQPVLSSMCVLCWFFESVGTIGTFGAFGTIGYEHFNRFCNQGMHEFMCPPSSDALSWWQHMQHMHRTAAMHGGLSCFTSTVKHK